MIYHLRKIKIVTVYNSPANNFTYKDLDKLFNARNFILILGIRSGIVTETIRRGHTLYKYCIKSNCSIIFPNKPTHYLINKMIPATIDVGFIKNVTLLADLMVLQELNSDHYPVFFTIGTTNI
ncbi:hypothetical protein V1478_011678 [Vespula squamosa]|uniref:Uncharacterized protein n=1 Tax=Vespula squamosa TaxID=30214 RepID=A0ABD2AF59_VESSQ